MRARSEEFRREVEPVINCVGAGIPLGIMLGSKLGVNTAIAMTLPSALIITVGIMLCSAAMIAPVIEIGRGIHLEFFQKNKPGQGTCCAFILGVTAGILSTFNAIAVLSLIFSTLPLSPFTLPFICVAGASSLAMLGLYAMTRPRQESVVDESNAVECSM